jgi:ABC-2 type transport system ATP-binding protein
MVAGSRRSKVGSCPTHGQVVGVKESAGPSFPFVVYLVRRVRVWLGPYHCPECGEPVARLSAREVSPRDDVEDRRTPTWSEGHADRRAAVSADGVYAVRVRGLAKAYGGVRAVQGIDLDIRRGEIFALLGPNGAGKTTTCEILEGYRVRDEGAVSVLGCDPGRERDRLKPRIGIVLQSTGVERYLTVRETVTMYAGLYPHPRPVDEVIDLVGLGAKRDERVIRLSGGQQRRLDVAIALAGDPELLFLDEPTTGFDPSARHEAWDVIKNLASLGKTVLLTTHYMDEAQFLADRVAVIAGGRIVAEGPPATLGARDRAQARIRYRLPAGVVPPNEFAGATAHDGFVELRADDTIGALHALTGWAIASGVELDGLEVSRPSLEDVYLSLTASSNLHDPRPPADGGDVR